jgi:ferredoxin
MVNRKVVLHFPKRLVDKPLVSHLIREYNLDFNILKASITPEEEGLMVLELKGKQEDVDRGIKFLSESGIIIDSLSQNVSRNENRCTDCGVCLSVCPTGAFEVDLVTRKVKFHDKKCVACALCIKACPPRAMELHF